MARCRAVRTVCDFVSTRTICRQRCRANSNLMARFSIFDIQARPNRLLGQILSAVLFIVCLGLYMHTSKVRHRDNAEDRIVPNAAQLRAGIHASILEPAEEDDYIAPEG